MKKNILARLKPKAASLGFNKQELEGAAAVIAGNFNSEEEATDEAIDAQIDAVLPFLKLGQQHATRLANKPTPKPDGNDGDPKPPVTPQNPPKTDDKNVPEWAKALIASNESLAKEITTLKADKTVSTRKQQLEAILKDSGKFGERTLKNFAKMNFESDEEFEEFLSDVEADLEEYQQDEGNETLSTVTKPPGTGDRKTTVKPLSDKEVEEIAASIT